MKLTWETPAGETVNEPVLEPIRSYVERIGLDATFTLVMALGGTYLYVPSAENGAGAKASAVIGEDLALKLADKFGARTHRVPVGRGFMIRYLRSKGHSVAEICTTVKVTDTSVREALRTAAKRRFAR